LYLLKNYFLSVGTFDISTELFLSLLSFHPKLSLSSSHFLFVLSALSSLFALSVVGSSVVRLAGVGLGLRRGLGSSVVGLSVGFSVEARNGVAWTCRRGGGSSMVGFSVVVNG
jgi:hypothetical protein